MKKSKKPKVVKKKRKPLPPHVRKAASKALMGNTFWKMREHAGVEALFTDPKELAEEAANYFIEVDANPWSRTEWRGRGLVDVPVKVPYSLKGLCLYLGVLDNWWRGFKETKTYASNKVFGAVMSAIEHAIYKQKFDGAASGFFNANIIARDLGLRENIDNTTAGQAIQPPVFNVLPVGQKLSSSEDEIK